jgi:dTDP-4-amino-4,6-dideoxygalactose transaminase
MSEQDDGILRVCRPLLPRAQALLPWLERIDASRHYTNRGPLVTELEARLTAHLGLPSHALRTASSGTAAIEVAILAHAGVARADRPLALIPAFTFAATALAAERCGYRPWLVDVDPENWAADPAALAAHPRLDQAGLIVAVAPYGRAPDMQAWVALQTRTGVPVVIDAAASFAAVGPATVSAQVPVTLSFHATKAFSTGEGGAVLWDDPAGQDRVEQVANFGFWRSRAARVAGTNAKMSEYHAAIGLAMLTDLPARAAEEARVTTLYARAVAGLSLGGRLILPPGVSPAYALFMADTPAGMARAEAHLHADLVETRCWYETGLQAQPHFARCGQDDLAVTADLGARLLGLPMAPDMTPACVARVIAPLVAAAAD